MKETAYAYPLTQSYARSLDAAEQDQKSAQWQRFPTPSFQSISPQGSNSKNNNSNVFALAQPLYAGGRIDAGINAANHRYTAVQHQHSQVAQETAIRLINTWYEWLRLSDRVVVQKESLEAHRFLHQQMQRRAKEGVSTDSDLALATARLSQIQSELSQTQAGLSAAREQLRQIAGQQLPALMTAGQALKPQTLPKPQADWVEPSLLRDPQLAKLSAELLAADADIKSKQGQLLPTVSLVMDRNFSGVQQDTRTLLQVTVQPGAGLSNVAAIRAAVARKESAIETRLNAELELRQSLMTDLSSHQSAVEQMGMASLLRQSTQEVAESYARQFIAGRKNWLEVLNAVREAMLARFSVGDAVTLAGQTAWRLHIRTFGLDDPQKVAL